MKRRGKTREWLKRREEKGAFTNIITELGVEDAGGFKEMMRMDYQTFIDLLLMIEKDITPTELMSGIKVIRAPERLVLTIRYFATGETFRSLSFQFRISRTAISKIVIQVSKAIISNMGTQYIVLPQTEEKWSNIAEQFATQWQFPNALGAIDGKHIVIKPPIGAGSSFYNYKHTHSIVLLAIAGPNYECLYADIGSNGRMNDAGIWNKSKLRNKIENNELDLPRPKCLPFSCMEVPYVFVGDDAFGLKSYMMKPYAQRGLTLERRIYNYRHSRARRISENLFGILANRWRLFLHTISLSPEKVEYITMAILILHNYLRRDVRSGNIYCPNGVLDSEDENGDLIPGAWRQDTSESAFQAIRNSNCGNTSTSGKKIRDTFAEYFVNEGCVDWQWDKC